MASIRPLARAVFFVRSARLSGSCLCDGEHSLPQEGHAVVAGDGDGSEKLMVRIKMISVRFTYYKHDHDDRSFETRYYFRW